MALVKKEKNESKNQDQKSFQLFVSLVHEIKRKLHGKGAREENPLEETALWKSHWKRKKEDG